MEHKAWLSVGKRAGRNAQRKARKARRPPRSSFRKRLRDRASGPRHRHRERPSAARPLPFSIAIVLVIEAEPLWLVDDVVPISAMRPCAISMCSSVSRSSQRAAPSPNTQQPERIVAAVLIHCPRNRPALEHQAVTSGSSVGSFAPVPPGVLASAVRRRRAA